MAGIKLLAPAPYWQGQTFSTAQYTADQFGQIVAAAIDVADLLKDGCQFEMTAHRTYNTPGPPVAPSSSIIINSQTLVAGATLTIAAQPDVPRQLQAVCTTGTGTLTAGSVALNYAANDGTTQTDVLNFGAADVTGTVTLTTTKGVEHLNSAVVGSPVIGGTGPTVVLGTNAYIALPLEPGQVNFAVTKETKITPTNGTLGLSVPADETVSTLTVSTGLISPTTAADGTHSFSFGYTYNYPT